jgi:hypothetical protein
MGRGSSEMTELTIIGEEANDLRSNVRTMEGISRLIAQLSEQVFPTPNASEESNAHRHEIRGQQALVGLCLVML